MGRHTLAEASELTGVDLVTLWKQVNDGSVSVKQDPSGHDVLETGELLKIYEKRLELTAESLSASEKNLIVQMMQETAQLESRAMMLERENRTLSECVDELRQERNAWRDQTRNLMTLIKRRMNRSETPSADALESAKREIEAQIKDKWAAKLAPLVARLQRQLRKRGA
ncbi:hypothetical protein [Magnetofaba australis]|uniref:Uncharacterized protein n=1 Tax=Magnetofaba australis IT-1 TaxID=1434232 RepID=A0A1Y2K6E3_9PROT|nr:hypothetical protein [Magnetofaba australis]OSM05113.1 hypothetical protein MAIT1_03262 [Magnetofaba australis IT-1]